MLNNIVSSLSLTSDSNLILIIVLVVLLVLLNKLDKDVNHKITSMGINKKQSTDSISTDTQENLKTD
jgi:hypothetical protein